MKKRKNKKISLEGLMRILLHNLLKISDFNKRKIKIKDLLSTIIQNLFIYLILIVVILLSLSVSK
jgi:hypothetical protein